uniref:Uncharacterized protein n=1 Tax=Caenorhabditis japonica TaxID=281687 RepID=A0A8R1EIZ8_CAEJA
MGNTVAGDLSSPLEDADMKTWRKNAKELQTYIYLQYKGCQFHDFTDLSRELRITNICFSIYGPPTENAGDLDCVYKSDQRKFAGEVYEKIVEVSKEAPEKKFLLGTLFISCKEQASEKEKRKEYQNIPKQQLLLFLRRYGLIFQQDNASRMPVDWLKIKNRDVFTCPGCFLD